MSFLKHSYGKFPYELKIARVMPLFKEGNSIDANNCRPLSILLKNWLTYILHILAINIGFVQKRSTHHALITLMDNITKSLDKGNMVAGVFLDSSNTINHKILLKKLYGHGIRSKMKSDYNTVKYKISNPQKKL